MADGGWGALVAVPAPAAPTTPPAAARVRSPAPVTAASAAAARAEVRTKIVTKVQAAVQAAPERVHTVVQHVTQGGLVILAAVLAAAAVQRCRSQQ